MPDWQTVPATGGTINNADTADDDNKDSKTTDEDSSEVAVREPDGQWMDLTRQMLQVRQLLSQLAEDEEGSQGEYIGDQPGLALPTLVVIGSQSSGKTSLVEALVGQHFLPKYTLASHCRFIFMHTHTFMQGRQYGHQAPD